ncbi:MAG TPA: GlsB/YeaQ/YmgE family stress response membrane protein [Baekduia sp.]
MILGFVAGALGRMLVPDMFSDLRGPRSWLVSLALGLGGAIVGYLIFTVGFGIGDTDVFDLGGLLSAVIGVIILIPFVGIFTRQRARMRGE